MASLTPYRTAVLPPPSPPYRRPWRGRWRRFWRRFWLDRANAKATVVREVLEVTTRPRGPYVATLLIRKGSQVERQVVVSEGGVVWRYLSDGGYVPTRIAEKLEAIVDKKRFLQKMHAAGLT